MRGQFGIAHIKTEREGGGAELIDGGDFDGVSCHFSNLLRSFHPDRLSTTAGFLAIRAGNCRVTSPF
jgi:hypothetical protein